MPIRGGVKRVVNFDVLRQLLGDNAVEDAPEAYEFNWVGKQAARAEVLKPIKKTLRPVKEDSVDWDNTQNLYIEGDNLEVLKLLQKSYLGKVKMIYIDPPYNTGKDFIYHDDFAMSVDEYAEASDSVDELGNKYIKNMDSNGRFHSDWCSMIYSRLMVARSLLSEDGRKPKLAKFQKDNFGKKEFQELWKRINRRTYYQVNFDTSDLVKKSVKAVDDLLKVTEIRIVVEGGSMENIRDKESLEAGVAMTQGNIRTIHLTEAVGKGVTYDLIGQLVSATGLTRKTIVEILKGIKPATFSMFKMNPEEFIIKTARIINDCKALAVIQCIKYEKLNDEFSTDIFTENALRGKLGVNAIESVKSLYDLVVLDSMGTEKNFAESLEHEDDVVVYTKLPRGFYINTPMGKYNPDWAVAFREGSVKHVYFIAETKGTDDLPSDLRGTENSKIECARKHFAAISEKDVIFDVVKNYQKLYDVVTK